MPRPTYGKIVENRVLDLLDTLLGYIDTEFECKGCRLKTKWEDEETSEPKLIVETTLKDLVALGKVKSSQSALTKAQIREALKRLEDFVEILVDHRADHQGAEDWNFTLTLWSKDKRQNLECVQQQWEIKRRRNLKVSDTSPQPKRSLPNRLRHAGVPFYAPPLPRCHVSRPEHLEAVKALLLSENTPNTLIISAIYGMGGLGKSVLAAELVREEEVLEAFPDGVLWVTLGQEPDLLPMVSQWIRELKDVDYKPTTLTAASKHLGSLLADKQALLVVDDVWQPDHVKPFEISGSGCRLLVTSRSTILKGALRHDLDVMSPPQALKLLTSYLREPLSDDGLRLAENFAQEVGYLPLALELGAALIEDGLTWEELLADFKEEVARLETLALDEDGTLGDESVRKERSLLASFYLTLKQLSPEQLQQFAWLGIIPEDVSITSEMVTTLWSVTVRQGGAILRGLKNRALLLPQACHEDQSLTYRVHDLVHDLALNLLTKDQLIGSIAGFGVSITDAHSLFIEQYRNQAQNGLWSALEDDGYIFRQLTWHMDRAGQPELIHQLLQERTSEGSNGWYEACDRLGQPAIFVTDLNRAWRLAEAMYSENKSRSVELQVRYALIFSSLNSLTSNIPAELMAALVEHQKWSPAQGLAYAQQSPDPVKRGEIIRELAVYLSPILLEQALEVARGIQDESSRASALSGLAGLLPEIVSEALEVARGIQSESYRARALSGLAGHLPEGLLSEALEVARGLQSESYRAMVLSSLAGHLPEGLLSEALEVARGLQDESYRAKALMGLAGHLPEIASEALEVARGIQDEYSRAMVLSSLAGHLPEIASEALEVARSIQDEFFRASALSSLAGHLPEGLLSEALEVARGIQNESDRAEALRGLAGHLPEIASEALEVARGIQNEYSRAEALRRLAGHLPEIVSEVLEVARGIQDESSRASALSSLAGHLPEGLLSEALEVARGIQDEHVRAIALSSLADHLPEGLLSEALEVARGIQDEYFRAEALIELAGHLPEGLLSEALEVARGIQHESDRAIALSSLAGHLPEIASEALEVARSIQHESDRALALSRLASHLPEELLSEALEVARGIQSESDRAIALIGLAGHLPEIASEALEVARGIQDEYFRAEALIGLAGHLPEIASEALEVVRGIQDEYSRARALSSLAGHLPEGLLSEALEVARGMQYESDRASALSSLAGHLPEGLLSEALEVARGMQYESDRAEALRGLAGHLPEGLLLEALEVARGIQSESDRAIALIGLTGHLPEIASEALEVARGIQSESDRARALNSLAGHLPEGLLLEALEVARGIQDESPRADVFSLAVNKIEVRHFRIDLFAEVLQTISNLGRISFLDDLTKLAPAIISLSNRSTLIKIVRSIKEVGQQWP